jgi:acyl-CoA reductase-like NAD-dependent aldehyde dehydrogenase
MMLVELAKEAGLPDGVVNCIHGQHEGKLKKISHDLKFTSIFLLNISCYIHLRSS